MFDGGKTYITLMCEIFWFRFLRLSRIRMMLTWWLMIVSETVCFGTNALYYGWLQSTVYFSVYLYLSGLVMLVACRIGDHKVAGLTLTWCTAR